MANREKGEVSLPAGDTEYTLVYSVNALCEIEEKLGLGFPAISALMADASTLSLRLVRATLWGGLRTHHPKITLAEAGDVIMKAGGVAKVLPIFNDAITLAFPVPEATEGGANPPHAPNQNEQTGSASATVS